MSCPIYRKAISWATDSEAPMPRWVERHLSRCPRCERFRQTELAIASTLARTRPTPADVPLFLHARIMANLEGEPRRPSLWLPVVRWSRSVLLPVSAVVLISGYCLWKSQGHKPSGYEAVKPPVVTTLLEPPAVDPKELLAWSKKFDQPLESELKAVVSDAKLALNSLTESFLPSQWADRTQF